MSSALQNRLVGTVIIVALVVIFLPDILDGKKQTNQQTFVDFPRNEATVEAKAPKAFPQQTVDEATQRTSEILDEVALDDENDAIDTTSSAALEPSTEQASQQVLAQTQLKAAQLQAENKQKEQAASAALAQQTVVATVPSSLQEDSGWVVQLGSFRHQKNVKELLDKLENAGYRAFSRKVDTSAGRLTKVFVGPELDKKKLENALPHLRETTGLKGRLAPFEVGTQD